MQTTATAAATPTCTRMPIRRRCILQSAAAFTFILATGSAAATDVNQANEAELDSVRGLGPPSTAAILRERAKAPFASWADLMQRVKGIKAARARRLSSEGLTVNGQPYPGQ